MQLQDIEDVQISEDAFNNAVKFILARVEVGKESKIVFRASTARFHDDIYTEFVETLDKTIEARVLGGGLVHIVPESKFIRLWGASTAFGPPDFETAEQLLRGKYPEFRIEIG